MRSIEEKMIAAVRQGRNWRSGNTCVQIVNTLGNWRVYLHGNLIATGGADGFTFTLAGWGTPTTRSRVNALLSAFAVGNASVRQTGGAQYFSQFGRSREIATDEWVGPSLYRG